MFYVAEHQQKRTADRLLRIIEGMNDEQLVDDHPNPSRSPNEAAEEKNSLILRKLQRSYYGSWHKAEELQCEVATCNKSSVLQSHDQGAIRFKKVRYRTTLVQHLVVHLQK